METLIFFASIAVGIALILALMGLMLSRVYRRASREVSLVKTGAGGRKVIMDGGTIVLPLLHELARVNMKTLRLEVRRDGEGALITKDRMRVDVGVEFYVSVNATEEGVARAAQTLGDKTFDVDALRAMIEGKLVDGLRAVAAQMSMDDLHEKRSDFVQQVQKTVSEDLLKNGLELESVSLTALDQTPFDKLDDRNAFNAIGMRALAEVIANSKRERARIEAETETAVRKSALEAAERKLEIDRAERSAQLQAELEIAEKTAQTKALMAQRSEEAEREAEEARIAREKAVRSADIAREGEIRAAEIARDERVKAADIRKDQALAVSEAERQILLAAKSEEESRARSMADTARAEAAKAEESVRTAREVAEAERARQITNLRALEAAEREATEIKVKAQTERAAAADRAEAIREIATAESDAARIRAEGVRAAAAAEAEGKRALIDAENAVSLDIIRMRIDIARLEALPAIVEAMVKPVEKIDSIRVHHITGMPMGQAGGGAGSEGLATPQAGAGDPIAQVFKSLQDMTVRMPALRAIGDSVGVSLQDGIEGITKAAVGTTATPTADGETAVRPRGNRPSET